MSATKLHFDGIFSFLLQQKTLPHLDEDGLNRVQLFLSIKTDVYTESIVKIHFILYQRQTQQMTRLTGPIFSPPKKQGLIYHARRKNKLDCSRWHTNAKSPRFHYRSGDLLAAKNDVALAHPNHVWLNSAQWFRR